MFCTIFSCYSIFIVQRWGHIAQPVRLALCRDEETEAAGSSTFVAHVPVPSQAEVEQYLLQRKRQACLQICLVM